ncbi:MAG: hypothetical protein QOE54_4194 [Streptosporangiaceae bacterium]|nr:hypothetical protein [Streptosporangiaceae bacterium]MDX6431828.1 hypothetical protein [Streptosporangiaceae bacterium]
MAPPHELKVDPAELKAQAGKLDTAGDDLNTKLGNAFKALHGLGGFWGDDDTGHTFYNGDGKPGYGAQYDNASTDINAMIKGYHDIAGGFQQMAKNIDVANWNSIVALPKVPK